jgi:hypothetical protein
MKDSLMEYSGEFIPVRWVATQDSPIGGFDLLFALGYNALLSRFVKNGKVA